MQRKYLIGLAAALVVVLAGVGSFIGYQRANSQSAYVAKVNGQTITTQDWNEYQTAVAGFGGHPDIIVRRYAGLQCSGCVSRSMTTPCGGTTTLYSPVMRPRDW